MHNQIHDIIIARHLQAKQHATQNKQGLGRSEVPKMAAGARWCGSKTKLDSDDEEEDQGAHEHKTCAHPVLSSVLFSCALISMQETSLLL